MNAMCHFQSPFPQILTFRDVQDADSANLLAWRNKPEVRQNMYTSRIIKDDEHRDWIAALKTDRSRRYWIIVWSGQDAGLVNFYNISTDHSRAHWAFYLADVSLQGRGIGAFIEFAILDYGFRHMSLNKLCCEVLDFNSAVLKLHKRFGFREEGIFRQHIHRENRFYDVHCLAILQDEWDHTRQDLFPKLDRVANALGASGKVTHPSSAPHPSRVTIK